MFLQTIQPMFRLLPALNLLQGFALHLESSRWLIIDQGVRFKADLPIMMAVLDSVCERREVDGLLSSLSQSNQGQIKCFLLTFSVCTHTYLDFITVVCSPHRPFALIWLDKTTTDRERKGLNSIPGVKCFFLIYQHINLCICLHQSF